MVSWKPANCADFVLRDAAIVETLARIPNRLLLVLAAIAVLVVLLFATGLVDDRAEPGSTGRVQVTSFGYRRDCRAAKVNMSLLPVTLQLVAAESRFL